MEENVAIDTSKQNKFIKSIKGIKKLIKKAGHGDVPDNVELESKAAKKSKRKRPERGLVYLSHIPHGFYEHEMAEYFKQFGGVSNVRVIRSRRTGNSKGYAFVEFKQPAVAEIVAETMNNYLMGKRLIKAVYIPPEKQRPKAMRKHWSRLNNPGRTERLKQKKAYNQDKDDQSELKRARNIMKNFKRNVKKLSEIGINYDFFTPVDIPEGLNLNTDTVKDSVKEEISKKTKDTIVEDKDSKSQKKNKSIKDVQKSVEETNNGQGVKKEKKNKPEPVVNKKEQNQKQQKLKDVGVKPPENFIKLQEADDSDSSVDFDSDDYDKMLENDSDADSDKESDGDSGEDESDDSGDSKEESADDEEFEITGSEDDSDVDESDNEEVIPLPKKGKGKGPILPQVFQTKKQKTQKGPAAPKQKEPIAPKQKGPIVPAQKGPIAPVQKGPAAPKQKGPIAPKQKGPIAPVQKGPIAPVQAGPIAPVPKGPSAPVQKGSKAQKKQESPEQIKRKAPERNAVSPKKPKFEKQTQQPMKKQFKKKK